MDFDQVLVFINKLYKNIEVEIFLNHLTSCTGKLILGSFCLKLCKETNFPNRTVILWIK